jgi:Holliday junction DNA helicase RuvA
MIAFLKGQLAAKLPDSIVVDVGGMGFAVGVSGNSLAKMPAVGQPVQVHTYLQVREDALTLYGFASTEEKSLFEKLIGVSGVGPKVALSALSTFTPEALSNAIMANDVTGVSRIPGIGKKTAQRMILELQGTLATENALASDAALAGNAGVVTEDLLAMGFTSAEAELALRDAPKDASETVLLQYALKRLGA